MLITGASRGIGAQIALQYARAGASLALVARSQATLDESKDAILRESPSAKILTFTADVRDVARAEEVVAATVAHFGRLDILIANAGTLRPNDRRALVPHTYIWCNLDPCCLQHSRQRIRMSGGMFLRSISVAPITLPSAESHVLPVSYDTLIIYDLALLFLNY